MKKDFIPLFKYFVYRSASVAVFFEENNEQNNQQTNRASEDEIGTVKIFSFFRGSYYQDISDNNQCSDDSSEESGVEVLPLLFG